MSNSKDTFMTMPLTDKVLEVMLNTKKKYFDCVCNTFKCSNKEILDTARRELKVTGMTVEVANTALDFLIDVCSGKVNDIPENTLVREIRRDILYSGTYYSNVKPVLGKGAK